MAKCNMKGKLLDSFTSFFNNKFYKIDKTSICTKLTFLNPKLEEKQSKIKFKFFPKVMCNLKFCSCPKLKPLTMTRKIIF